MPGLGANPHRPGLWPGLALVSLGVGLMAREFGLLPATIGVLDFWPLVVVFVGISVLLRAQGVVSALLALAFIATGGVLLSANLGFVTSSVTRLWPGLLVLLGLWALLRGGRGPEDPVEEAPPRADFSTELDQPGNFDDAVPEAGAHPGRRGLHRAADPDRLNRQYTCAGAELRIESQAWKGGELGVTAGGVELDLRHARLDPAGAVLVLRVLMGGVEIRVPDTWHVDVDIVPLLGGADDSTRSTQGASSAPRLRVTGNVTLGGVNVSN